MAAELGAQAGLIAPDEVTAEFVRSTGAAMPADWQDFCIEEIVADDEAIYYQADELAPQIAAPHSPENADNAEAYRNTKFDLAYIGACTGAKYVDLVAAATVLKGRKIASGITLKVAPASAADQQRAEDEGVMQILADAGAEFLANSCGICAGYGADRLAEKQVCLSSTARNFKGRMGAPSSEVYLASPYTVAASAVAGSMIDPREILEG